MAYLEVPCLMSYVMSCLFLKYCIFAILSYIYNTLYIIFPQKSLHIYYGIQFMWLFSESVSIFGALFFFCLFVLSFLVY